jgi:hypothetical protein
MIAYNSDSIKNISIVQKSRQWFARGYINKDQLVSILSKYQVDFYMPNLWVQVGLFLFTCFTVLAAMGLYGLTFFSIANMEGVSFLVFSSLLFAVGCVIALELVIKGKKAYHSGMDDALVLAALGFIATAVYQLLGSVKDNNFALLYAFLLFPFLAAAVVRYANRMVTIALVFCDYSIFFLLVMKFGHVAKVILPFALMLLSAANYYLAQRLKKEESLFCWKDCIEVLEVIALLIFYLAGNYFVVRESSVVFFDMHLAEGENIPFAFLFYLLTAVVPLAYIWFSLKQKDRTMLWVGLILTALSVITFKYYFSLGHPEITLVVAGLILVGIAWWSFRKLKAPIMGLSSIEDEDEETFFKTNAEALLILQTMHHHPSVEKSEGFDGFGGGKSGGGGASGSY